MAIIAQSITTYGTGLGHLIRRLTTLYDSAIAQTFTALLSGDVGVVSLLLARNDEAAVEGDTYLISIRPTSGGVPASGSGADLGSVAFSWAGIPITPAYAQFDFDFGGTVAVVSGVQYAIVVKETTPTLPSPVGHLLWRQCWLYGGGNAHHSPNNGETTWQEIGGDVDGYFIVNGAVIPPPTLFYPDNGLTNVYLNKDWLLQMTWEDSVEEDISAYTVWFYDPVVGTFVEQTDRSRYSIISLFMWLGYTLQYSTTYQWFVRKTIDDVDYDSATWTFTTAAFSPPAYSTREKVIYGGDPENPDDRETVPSGENNQLTVKRLIVAARNKIFYEDV